MPACAPSPVKKVKADQGEAHGALKGNKLTVRSAIMHLTDEIFCSLHVHLSVAAGISRTGGGGWHGCIRASRARGSVPPLITIEFACLCEGVH